MINITASTGDLELLQTAIISFERSEGVWLTIGSIKVQFDIANFSMKRPDVTREAFEDALTLVYKVTGKIGCNPHSFGLIRPERIGTSDGLPIFMWWRLSQSISTRDVLVLSYSVFTQRAAGSEQSPPDTYAS